jgi:hypothetical protein
MKLFKLLFALTLMLTFYTSPVIAEYSYQLINHPGAVFTQTRGINEAGKVVGEAFG